MKKASLILAFLMMLVACNDGKIKELKKDEPKTEKHIETYPNGQVKIRGNLVKGIRQGKWEAFYENGVKWSESNYLFGKRNGIYKVFYPNGRLKIHGVYENETKVDVWFFYRENGQFEKEVNFNKKAND